MSEQELAKLPQCHICGAHMSEGSRTQAPPGKHLYLCDDCRGFFRALVHDLFGGVLQDIAEVFNDQEFEQLENYSYGDSQP
jgi:hypothetical protein